MSDNGDSNGDGGGSGENQDALGKDITENSKTVEKGTTAEGNAGEEGGYGFIPPSAESGGDGAGSSSDSGNGSSDE